MGESKRPYTQSELSTYRDCKRKWWLGTHRGLRLKEQFQKLGAAWTGSLVHMCMEADDLGQDWQKALTSSLESGEQLFADMPDKLKATRDAHSMAEAVVGGYFQWLEDTGVDQFVETLGVEEKISVPFKGRELMGKLDKRARNTETGEEFFIDYKTVGDLGEIPRKAAVNEQFLHYTLLLILRDPNTETYVRKGVWRMMKKSKRTDRTLKDDGTEQEFYGEHEYTYNEHQLDSYMVRLESIIQEIERTAGRLDAGEDHRAAAYPTPHNDCYWKCEFYGICPMFDDGSRVESFIEDWYDERDPLERYQDLSTPTESE